jgi:hypothetical protein
MPALNVASISSFLMPASSIAFQAASACICMEDLWGRLPISSDSATPMMATCRERLRRSRAMFYASLSCVMHPNPSGVPHNSNPLNSLHGEYLR